MEQRPLKIGDRNFSLNCTIYLYFHMQFANPASHPSKILEDAETFECMILQTRTF